MIDARVQAGDFDPGRQLARLEELKPRATASFTALIEAARDVEAIFVDHYPALAKAELARIAGEAEQRWGLAGVVLIHRHGRFAPGDRLAFAGVAAGSHETAFEACTWLAEALRTRVPFWRKELHAGGGRWAVREERG